MKTMQLVVDGKLCELRGYRLQKSDSGTFLRLAPLRDTKRARTETFELGGKRYRIVDSAILSEKEAMIFVEEARNENDSD